MDNTVNDLTAPAERQRAAQDQYLESVIDQYQRLVNEQAAVCFVTKSEHTVVTPPTMVVIDVRLKFMS